MGKYSENHMISAFLGNGHSAGGAHKRTLLPGLEASAESLTELRAAVGQVNLGREGQEEGFFRQRKPSTKAMG